MAAKRKSVTQAAPEIEAEVAPTPVAAAPSTPGIEAETETTTTPMSPAGDIAQTMEKTMKTAEDFLAFGQSNMDAFVKSSQIWAAGVQDITKQVAATAQASFDDTMAAFKAMAAVKTPKDALDLQANLVRSSLEKAVAETGKVTDASLKLAEQVFAPITAQMNAAVEKFAKVV